jgi:hypothetical protein
VIGKSNSKNKMAALNREVEEYDDFVLLDLEEEYSRLPYKTYGIEVFTYHYAISVQDADFVLCFRLAFFKAAYALYDSDFYVKADDDIYLRPGE